MSAEETIRALLHGTVDVVRRTLRDATAEALVEDYSDALRKVLRQAYEVGYREGLARAGHPADVTGSAGTADTGEKPPAGDATALQAVSASLQATEVSDGAPAATGAEEDDLEPEAEASAPQADAPAADSEDVEGEEPRSSPEASAVPAPLDWGREAGAGVVAVRRREPSRDTASLRIFPHATVGTLLQRIHDYFGLERFDIDVVVCRKGDRARRQLKKTVRLAKYEVGE